MAATFFLVAYVLWEIQFSIYRYLAIPETLAGVLALAAAGLWMARLGSPSRHRRTRALGLLAARSHGLSLVGLPGGYSRWSSPPSRLMRW